jgi:aspartyl-tRNA(Asn)/glutamyl-tRNA(Gln) amidotransferase subunit B
MALRSILRYLAASSGDMEKGAIRFEANVSVRPEGSTLLGTRTEIKNLNSFRSMVHAVTCEIERQSRVRAEGGEVWQETVGWDEARSVTFSQRGKEEADDYRYFPEPDLPPLVVDRSWVGRLRTGLPELPDAKRLRFQVQHGLTPYLAGVLTADRTVADYFEEALLAAPELRPEKIANWVAGDLFGLLNQAGLDITASKVRPAMLAELVGLVESGEVNSASAKVALGVSFAKGTPPRQVVHEQRLGQLSDRAEIDRLVSTVLGQNPEQVRQYLAGKRTIAQWLFGQVMRAGGGRANPALVQDQLTAALVALEQRPPDL